MGHADAQSWAVAGRIWPKVSRYASFLFFSSYSKLAVCPCFATVSFIHLCKSSLWEAVWWWCLVVEIYTRDLLRKIKNDLFILCIRIIPLYLSLETKRERF
jgi:hypothetical protein